MRHAVSYAFALAVLVGLSSPSYAFLYGTTNQFEAVSGHYSGYDGRERMYAAAGNSSIWEIVYGVGVYFLANPTGTLRALASYYDNAYGDEHVILSTTVGIEEIWYQPGNGVHTDWIYDPGFDPQFVSIGAFYAPSDNNQHVIAANGMTLTEFWWGPSSGGIHSRALATLPASVLNVSGYYTPYDGHMHAAVLGNDGTIYEVWWPSSTQPASVVVIWPNNPVAYEGVQAFGTTSGGPADYEDFLYPYQDQGNKYYYVNDVYWNSGSQTPAFSDFTIILAVGGWYIPGYGKAVVIGDVSGSLFYTWQVDETWQQSGPRVAHCDASGCYSS